MMILQKVVLFWTPYPDLMWIQGAAVIHYNHLFHFDFSASAIEN